MNSNNNGDSSCGYGVAGDSSGEGGGGQQCGGGGEEVG